MVSPAPRSHDITVSHRFEHARVATLLLGLWLVATIWLWRHFEVSRVNTWVVGVLVASFALLALRRPILRWANVVFSGWLLISTLFVVRPVQPETWWNNLLVAVSVLGCALLSHRSTVTTIATPSSRPPQDRT